MNNKSRGTGNGKAVNLEAYTRRIATTNYQPYRYRLDNNGRYSPAQHRGTLNYQAATRITAESACTRVAILILSVNLIEIVAPSVPTAENREPRTSEGPETPATSSRGTGQPSSGKKERCFGPIAQLHQRSAFTFLSYRFLLSIPQPPLPSFIRALHRHSFPFRASLAQRGRTPSHAKQNALGAIRYLVRPEVSKTGTLPRSDCVERWSSVWGVEPSSLLACFREIKEEDRVTGRIRRLASHHAPEDATSGAPTTANFKKLPVEHTVDRVSSLPSIIFAEIRTKR